MIDLLDAHLTKLRSEILEPELAVAAIGPYLRPGAGSPELLDHLLEAPLRIPPLLRALETVIDREPDPRVRGFAGGIYAYVFNPIDIIPEEELGYVGFVEDAYICWRGLGILRDRFRVRSVPDISEDEPRMNEVWEAFSDEVQAAIDGFFRQFEQILTGLEMPAADSEDW